MNAFMAFSGRQFSGQIPSHIVGRGPGECHKAFIPLIWCPAISDVFKQRAGTGTRPYNRGCGVVLVKMCET